MHSVVYKTIMPFAGDETLFIPYMKTEISLSMQIAHKHLSEYRIW